MATQNISMDPIIFINIGWTIHYAGIIDNDPISGGHTYFKDHDIGHELWNFQKTNASYYGYIPRSLCPDFRNFSVKKSNKSIDNILVIWVATDPRDKRHKIVGWYKNATIVKKPFTIEHQDITVKCNIKTKAYNGVLLNREQRSFIVPTTSRKRGIEGLGRSPIWYGTKEINEQVRKYILNFENKISKVKKKKGKRKTPEHIKQVENIAINHAKQFFESIEGGEWHILSVERENLGWDLTASRNDETLKIEVKGLSDKKISVVLTPNEYKTMMSPKHRKQYVIYILAETLSNEPKPFIFYYNSKKSKKSKYIWEDQYSHELNIEEKITAILTR